jgi:hypothetical protein
MEELKVPGKRQYTRKYVQSREERDWRYKALNSVFGKVEGWNSSKLKVAETL